MSKDQPELLTRDATRLGAWDGSTMAGQIATLGTDPLMTTMTSGPAITASGGNRVVLDVPGQWVSAEVFGCAHEISSPMPRGGASSW
jgi:hypothetical protein